MGQTHSFRPTSWRGELPRR